jgi:hypothetical protein
MRKSGLPQPGRAIKQDVVQRFLTFSCGGDQNGQVLFHLLLANDIAQLAWA